MTSQPDLFRDYGLDPHSVTPPQGVVRSSLSWGQVIGQLAGTGLMSTLGLGMAAAVAFGLGFPAGVSTAVVPLAIFGYIVYRVTRNDYSWVESDGEVIRARHLYTRRVVERSIGEIQDLLTAVYQIMTTETEIAEKLLGRVRGITIRFRDQRTPLHVSFSDPAMKNARELIEAVIYRMWQKGDVAAEVIDLDGKPLIRRIHWK